MDVVVDKLTILKHKLITAYTNLSGKLQRGYPLKDYELIKDAMLFVRYSEDSGLDQATSDSIADSFIHKLAYN